MNLILSKVFRILFILYLFVGFTIFNDHGFVAVCDENGRILRTQTRVATLPASDAARINASIACKDETELASVLENYIS